VLSAAIQELFVPVLIYNCPTPGSTQHDKDVLKAFEEPSWNNPVARILDAGKQDVIPRINGVYKPHGIAAKIIEALRKADVAVPTAAAKTLAAVAAGEDVSEAQAQAFRDAVSDRISRTLVKSLASAVRLYESRKLGAAHKAASRLRESAGATEEEKADATYLMELVAERYRAAQARAARLQESREYVALFDLLTTMRKEYAGLTGLEEWATPIANSAQDKTVRAEIKALEAYAKLEAKLAKADDDKSRAAAKKKLVAFIERNEGTRAAEKAAALLEE
jgi:hypothetical protein